MRGGVDVTRSSQRAASASRRERKLLAALPVVLSWVVGRGVISCGEQALEHASPFVLPPRILGLVLGGYEPFACQARTCGG